MISWNFETIAHTRVESHEKANSEASAKWKEVKGKPNKINESVLNTKIDPKKWWLDNT